MATRADDLIERHRLRRKLTFWRVAALAVAGFGIAAAAYALGDDGFRGRAVDHIAKIKIEGTITEDEKLIERLEDIRKANHVKGVILSIDSPGGTTVGGEAIYEQVRKLARDKPVAAQVGTLAASAGYMIATATDHIVARQSSIIGSIGVLIQFPNFTNMMEKLGITLDEVKSSPLKAEPSPFNPTTEPERAMLRSMILDSYDWFVGLVEERRPLSRAEVTAIADGSVFTGRQALQRKLVDSLGGEEKAIDWLGTKGVDTKLEVVEWKPEKSSGGFFFSQALSNRIAQALGLPSGSLDVLHELGAERLFLDGLLSVWHPERAAIRG
ncbi:signal peptide peptidase SppA [Arvimicrobium flavum]|uniref:signal peptide peptidase SppA n=1 Tax=Arvimicrobium flavum TaxID=3393320 RepID=UPI00237C41B0|nr:signal peptide peptidase SppA [Mesorhizobium shangrilense]